MRVIEDVLNVLLVVVKFPDFESFKATLIALAVTFLIFISLYLFKRIHFNLAMGLVYFIYFMFFGFVYFVIKSLSSYYVFLLHPNFPSIFTLKQQAEILLGMIVYLVTQVIVIPFLFLLYKTLKNRV